MGLREGGVGLGGKGDLETNLGKPSGAAKGLGKKRQEGKGVISNPASIPPCVPRVDPDWPFSELRAQDQEGVGMRFCLMPMEGEQISEWSHFPGPFVATIAMGVGIKYSHSIDEETEAEVAQGRVQPLGNSRAPGG